LSGLQRFNDLGWTNVWVVQRINEVSTISFAEFGENEIYAPAITNGLSFNFA
jgi:hypothetical protein